MSDTTQTPAATPTIFDQLRDRARAEAGDDTVRVEPQELTTLRKAARDAALALRIGQVDRYEALCRALARALADTVAAQGFKPMTDERALAVITQRFPITELEAT